MRICVIGAGAAGIVAIRRIQSTPELTGIVYEQSNEIGGIWCYSSNQKPLGISPMYKNLRTNLPKEIMEYMDFRFRIGKNSFVSHEDVNKYLNDYVDNFELRDLIQFEKRVVLVKPCVAIGSMNNNDAQKQPTWEVTVADVKTGHEETLDFDTVMVCNGHFNKPAVPYIPNIGAFKGEVLHSKDYQSPEDYSDKRVAIVGCGPSAVDISLEIAGVAAEVIRCFRVIPGGPPLAKNIRHVGPVREVRSSGFIFDDDEELKVDSLILATGYEYDFPFLDPACGVVVEKGKLITPLYRHMIHTHYPTLCFVGIPFRVLPFYLFDIQVCYLVKYLSGNLRLPSESQMNKEWQEDVETRKARGLPHSQCHMLGDSQWEYFRTLAEEAGFTDELKPVFKKIYDHVDVRRKQFPATYKDDMVRIVDQETYTYEPAKAPN